MKLAIASLILCSLLAPVRGQAVPLTLAAIQKARRIAIMPGTFDPVTTGHLAVARLAITKGGADITILTASENPTKHPIPRVKRIEMIGAAAENLNGILYPAPGGDLYDVFKGETLFGITAAIRKANPDAEIDVVVGSDVAAKMSTTELFTAAVRPRAWLIVLRPGFEEADMSAITRVWRHQIITGRLPDVSSSKIKAELQAHPEYYKEGNRAQVAFKGLDPKVTQIILENGYYQEPTAPPGNECLGLVSEAWNHFVLHKAAGD